MATANSIRLRMRRVARNLEDTSFSKASTAIVDLDSVVDQSQSVLYSKLPSEIRTRIFEYALSSSDDLTKPYLPDRVYYRPGYHYHQKTEISLLQTCKQVFVETRLMPVAQTEHVFWLFGGPFQKMKTLINGMARFEAWTGSLNDEQQQAVNHVHVFAQQHYLENMGRLLRLSLLAITTKHLTLTFRHSDWWSWESPAESSDKLGICPWLPGRVSHQAMLAHPIRPSLQSIREATKPGTWGHQICQVMGLSVLRIEFETDIVKKAQLQQVLERARYWKFPLEETNAFLEQVGEIREYVWEGLANLKDDNTPMLNPPPVGDPTWNDRPKRNYYVAEMTWKKTRIDE